MSCVVAYVSYLMQAVDIKLLSSLNREDLKKICGDSYPEWISFPIYEQVKCFVDFVVLCYLLHWSWVICAESFHSDVWMNDWLIQQKN